MRKGSKYSDWMGLPLSKTLLGISNDVTESIKARMYPPGFRAATDKSVESYFEKLLPWFGRVRTYGE